MIVQGLLAVLIFASLLTGCVAEDLAKLRSDARILKSYISKSHYGQEGCIAPGNPQDKLCNYKLVVKDIGGGFYQAHVDPDLVAKGEESCKAIFESEKYKKSEAYRDDPVQDYKCALAKDYTYWIYEFRIVGEKPEEGVGVEFVNVPRTDMMRKGHIDDAKTDLGKIGHVDDPNLRKIGQ